MRTTPSLLLLTLLLPACGGGKATEGQNAGECTDGADNDADGAFDCDDSDCAGAPDCGGDTGGDDTGAAVNTAPSAPTVAIVPEAPSDDDVLNCVITGESVDPDGDTVTYAYSWTVNGSSAGITTAIVGAERTNAGETWGCSVVASDGELVSGVGTASVVVSTPTLVQSGIYAYYAVTDSTDETLVDSAGLGRYVPMGVAAGADSYDPIRTDDFLIFNDSCVKFPFNPDDAAAGWAIQLALRAPEQSGQVRLWSVRLDGRARWQSTPTGADVTFGYYTGTSDGSTMSTTVTANGALDETWHVLTYNQSADEQMTAYVDATATDRATLHASPAFGTFDSFVLGGDTCGHDGAYMNVAAIVLYQRGLTPEEVGQNVGFLQTELALRGLSAR